MPMKPNFRDTRPIVDPMQRMPGGGNPPVMPARPRRLPMSDASSLPIGAVYKKGGKVSASKRADGIAQRGKTRGRIV